jgi:hypothetical protein
MTAEKKKKQRNTGEKSRIPPENGCFDVPQRQRRRQKVTDRPGGRSLQN